jgi:hypothetical protein
VDRRRIDRLRAPRAFLGYVQIAMGLAALASIVLYDRAFDAMAWLIGALAKTDGGYALFNLGSAGIAMAIMLPATFAAGMTLPLITYLLLRDGFGERAIGYVYAWNTVGAIAGVLVAVHVGLPQFGLAGTLIAAAAIDIALGVALLGRWRTLRGAASRRSSRVARAGRVWRRSRSRSTRAARSPASTAPASRDPRRDDDPVRPRRQDRDGQRHALPTGHRHDPHQRQARRVGEPRARPLVDARRRVDDDPRRGAAAAARAARARRRGDRVRIGHDDGDAARPADDPSASTRSRSSRDDRGRAPLRDKVARAYTTRAADRDRRREVVFREGGRRYDIIVSEPSNPWVAGVSSLFTGEFYGRRPLPQAGGVLAQWLQATSSTSADGVDRQGALGRVPERDALQHQRHRPHPGRDARREARRRPDALFASPAFAQRLASAGIASPPTSTGAHARRARRSRFVASATRRRTRTTSRIVELNAPGARFKGVVEGRHRPARGARAGRRPGRATRAARRAAAASPPSASASARTGRCARGVRVRDRPGLRAGDALPDIEHARDIANARAALVDCVAPRRAAIAWDSVVALAGEFAGRSAADMDRYVAAIERSRCRKRPARRRRPSGSRLFRAIGRRDAAPTADGGRTLLARDDLDACAARVRDARGVAGLLGAGQARGRAQAARRGAIRPRRRVPRVRGVPLPARRLGTLKARRAARAAPRAAPGTDIAPGRDPQSRYLIFASL